NFHVQGEEAAQAHLAHNPLGPVVNPIAYSKDRHPKRTLFRMLSDIRAVQKMRRFYPHPTESGF
ncbi:hypothetical protein R6H00_10685, partial [Actinotignum timonense]|nr:hypothetical protein [Actinotignum timonense]